jgi:solute carrier family 25 protein 34/35
MAAATISNPFDVVRARRQGAMGASSSSAELYGNPARALQTMLKTRGVADLYTGIRAAFGHNLVLNGIRIGFFETTRVGIADFLGTESLLASLAAGFATGATGALFASPFTLVKNRQQAWIPPLEVQGAISARYPVFYQIHPVNVHRTAYYHTLAGAASVEPPKSAWKNFTLIVRTKGVAALWTGSKISALRVGAGSAFQLGFYDRFRLVFSSANNNLSSTSITLASALASGMLTSFLMTPLDLILTRVQATGRSAGAVLRITVQEGLPTFWKGGSASLLRTVPHTVVTFLLYEELRWAFAALSSTE